MLHFLFENSEFFAHIPGSGMFAYISFRSAAAIIASLLIAIIFGRQVINYLRTKQIGEEVRDLGLEGQLKKQGTPTMGGLIILGSVLIPILLFADLTNVYVQLMILTTVWLGFVGFIDDYIKVVKGRKAGLSGKFKIVGQVGLGIIVGSCMWMSSDIVIKENVGTEHTNFRQAPKMSESFKSTATTIPFFKDSELDYRDLVPIEGDLGDTVAWIIYVLVATVVITAVSNGANLTDGLDGLTVGISAPIVLVLGIMAYLSGNIIYSEFLDIMHIPGSGELMVFAAAFIGALLGFLWYNSYPASVFMGDTGSLAIGGIIATFALLIRKELLLPILCGIFFVESLSVIIQVVYFRYTRKKYGEGKRIFLMAPLHHHYQKRGYFESKITMRFWIIQLLLAAVTLLTLKIR